MPRCIHPRQREGEVPGLVAVCRGGVVRALGVSSPGGDEDRVLQFNRRHARSFVVREDPHVVRTIGRIPKGMVCADPIQGRPVVLTA
eukprot:scaffold161338_cov31-Tisochrysis_lutea.AAC.3